MEVQPGQLWKHYKGTVYRIMAIAKNSQTDDLYDVVIYQDTTEPEKIWTQSLERFLSPETKDGATFPRFALVG